MQKKNIIICCYQSICEPDIIEAFQKNGYQVAEINREIDNLDYDVTYIKNLSEVILSGEY